MKQNTLMVKKVNGKVVDAAYTAKAKEKTTIQRGPVTVTVGAHSSQWNSISFSETTVEK